MRSFPTTFSRRTSFAVLASIAVLFLLGTLAPARAADGPTDIVPSGVIRTYVRQPGAFTRIAIDGPMNVEIHQAPRSTVTLHADDNLLAILETTISKTDSGSTLHIRYRGNITMRSKPTVDVVIETDRVDAVVLGGVGNIVARGLKTPKLEATLGGVGRIDLGAIETDALTLTIGGNGSIRADGHARALTLLIGGNGNSDTAGLVTDDAAVTIAGHGDATLRADKSLGVTIAGNGNVTYRGDAVVHTTILGHGKVTKG
jgi:hypothetical protein